VSDEAGGSRSEMPMPETAQLKILKSQIYISRDAARTGISPVC
jgi:hypothetical protein